MTQTKENTPQATPDLWADARPVALATLTEIAGSETASAANRIAAAKALADARRALSDAQRALAGKIAGLEALQAERNPDVFG